MVKRVKMNQITIEEVNLMNEGIDEIKLGNNLLIRLYADYKGIKITRKTKIDNIKKIMLPSKKEEALKMLNEGIEINNKKYFPLMTSPSFMKKEDEDTKRKLSYLFIVEEDLEFRDVFMDICSLGKVPKLYNQELSINKDIVARLALQLSSSLEVNYMPRVLILPETSYTTVENYYVIESKKLIPKDNLEAEHTFSDGCGFMTPAMADRIGQELGIDYRVDFAGLRWLMATKGLIVRCDFKKYFKEMYEQTDINTNYFKVENGKILVKDCFNHWIDIDSVDLILNETQTKWSKLYKQDGKEVDINKVLRDELKKDKYDKYRNTLSKMYITKVNKREVPTIAKTNYQLLQNLLLTVEDMSKLQRKSLRIYNDLLECKDVNKLRLFLGDIARTDEDELSASTKVHRLLQLDEDDAIKLKMTRSTIKNNIKKKFYEVASGEFFVESFGYLTAMTCPITTLDWIMTRDLEKCNRGLKAKEFYIADESDREFVLSRNPVSVFSEIQKIKTVNNNLIEKYMPNLTKELIIYNQKDNAAMLMSGMDFDLDMVFVTWNKTILNSVVPLLKDSEGIRRNYINLQDSKGGVKHNFTLEQLFEDTVDGSGNLIGAIANKSSLLCNLAQSLDYLKIVDGKKVITNRKKEYKIFEELDGNKELVAAIKEKQDRVKELKNKIKELEKVGKSSIIEENKIKGMDEYIKAKYKSLFKKFNAYWKSKEVKTEVEFKEGKFLSIRELTQIKQKQIMCKQFHELAELNYQITELSMLAIDQPKNLKPIDVKKEMEEVNNKLKELGNKKGRFMFYARWSKNKDNKNIVDFDATHKYNTALDIKSSYVYKNYIKECNMSKGNDTITLFRKLFKDKCVSLDECNQSIFTLYNKYVEARDIAKNNKDYTKKARRLEFNRIDLIASIEMQKLEQIYSKEEIINALIKNELMIEDKRQKVCSSRFIINTCWNSIEALLREENHDITIFKLKDGGEYEWLEKNYEKLECKLDKEGKIQLDMMQQIEDKFSIEVRICLDEDFGEVDKLDQVILSVNENQIDIITEDGERVGNIYTNNKTTLKNGRDLINMNKEKVRFKDCKVVGKAGKTLLTKIINL